MVLKETQRRGVPYTWVNCVCFLPQRCETEHGFQYKKLRILAKRDRLKQKATLHKRESQHKQESGGSCISTSRFHSFWLPNKMSRFNWGPFGHHRADSCPTTLDMVPTLKLLAPLPYLIGTMLVGQQSLLRFPWLQRAYLLLAETTWNPKKGFAKTRFHSDGLFKNRWDVQVWSHRKP